MVSLSAPPPAVDANAALVAALSVKEERPAVAENFVKNMSDITAALAPASGVVAYLDKKAYDREIHLRVVQDLVARGQDVLPFVTLLLRYCRTLASDKFGKIVQGPAVGAATDIVSALNAVVILQDS